MSFHELISGYPWLTKRAAHVAGDDEPVARNRFAYVLAIFVPYGGRLGGGLAFLIMVYIVGVTAAIAIPAYQDYTVRAKLSTVALESQPALDKLAEYYASHQQIPDSLETAGVPAQLADGSPLALDPARMLLTVTTQRGELVFVPSTDAQGRIVWACANGEGIKASQVPASCRPGVRR
jgi:Tfp pilus assembly major pilin PilA